MAKATSPVSGAPRGIRQDPEMVLLWCMACKGWRTWSRKNETAAALAKYHGKAPDFSKQCRCRMAVACKSCGYAAAAPEFHWTAAKIPAELCLAGMKEFRPIEAGGDDGRPKGDAR